MEDEGVGKTYLIRNYYVANLKFVCAGESGGTMSTQLANFQQQMNAWFPANRQLQPPANWQQAFVALLECLNTLKTKEKKVLFFDELPGWILPNQGLFQPLDISGIYICLRDRIYSS